MNDLQESTIHNIQNALRTNKLGAKDESGGCLYEAEDGTHCLVGHLLTAEEIKKAKALGINEETNAKALFINLNITEEITERTGFSVKQLTMLQAWHDSWANGEITKPQFEQVLHRITWQEGIKLTHPIRILDLVLGEKVDEENWVQF